MYSKQIQITTRADQLHTRLTINVEHHVPHGRTDRLMETKPHLPASTQRMVIALRRGEKWTPHWSIPVFKKKKHRRPITDQINQHRLKPPRLMICPQDYYLIISQMKFQISQLVNHFGLWIRLDSKSTRGPLKRLILCWLKFCKVT